ncbi:MAG: YjjG family noncanonical pyrimidine nucleotidase [bacterium]
MLSDQIKTIFFDLDNTLFDHTRAEQTALRLLMQSLPDVFLGVEESELLNVYHAVNTFLWQQMAQGQITADELKLERFKLVFDELNLRELHLANASERYLQFYLKQPFYLPGSEEILKYLKPEYDLGILSNGFAEIQHVKLNHGGLEAFFKYRVYSENVGALKPSPLIFAAAKELTGRSQHEIVYVGDVYESDVLGARAAGWHAIWFNPDRQVVAGSKADAEIATLLELRELF